MATKKELIDAQGFSRRRLLSAFIGGAPGGKELEPAQPLRAVVAGIALTAMVILGGVFYGFIRPGLPEGWENNRLILASDTGARYVSLDGKLYPVINTASARLIIEADEFAVITTDQATLEGIEIGATLGILGAPDALATPDQLINDGWSACQRDAQTALAISTQIQANAVDDATVVRVNDVLYVISGKYRYKVDPAAEDPILRAVGLSSVTPEDVDSNWLGLFTEGADLSPIVVKNAGTRITGSDLVIGSAIHPQGTADSNLFLVTADSELAELSPLAYQLFLLGSGSELGEAEDVSPAGSNLPNSGEPAGGIDWPKDALTPLVTDENTCALLTHVDGAPLTVLSTLRDDSPITADDLGVTMEGGHGSLVYTGDGDAPPIFLIDESGTSYAIPGATEDVLARLGYELDDIDQVTPAWLKFMAPGPALDIDSAGKTPQANAATDAP